MDSSSIKCISLNPRRDTEIKRQEYKHKLDHIARKDQPKLIPLLALVTMVGIAYFVVGVGVLHFLRPDYNPVNHAVSNYAVGPFGYLMTSAFFVLALSVMTLAASLFFSIALSNASQVAILLLCLSSCGIVVMAIFPGDAHALHPPVTTTGVIHWAAAAFSFLCIMVAAFLLASSFKTDERFQRFQQLCLELAMAMVGALLLYGVLALVGWVGIGQRIYLIISLLWLFLLAMWIWTSSRRQRLS
jgi:hypothetical protein